MTVVQDHVDGVDRRCAHVASLRPLGRCPPVDNRMARRGREGVVHLEVLAFLDSPGALLRFLISYVSEFFLVSRLSSTFFICLVFFSLVGHLFALSFPVVQSLWAGLPCLPS